MFETTDFQKRCIDECRVLLNTYSKKINFEKIDGKKEKYFYANIPGLKHKLEIYIYDNEAGFMINGDQWHICESPDYDNNDALISDFLSGLKEKGLE